MKWSDSIFADTPDQQKLEFLANCCGAVYSGTLADVVPTGANATLVYPGPPVVWTFNMEGEKVAVFAGTTNQTQYAGQATGWISLQPFARGGYLNGYVATVGSDMYLSLPNDIKVLAGHSLGGGLACYVADRMVRNGLNPVGVVTYGMPRYFTADAAAATGWLPVVNVTNHRDPVALVVPDGTSSRNWRSPGRFFNVSFQHKLGEVTQGASTQFNLTATLAAYGDQYHTIGTYIELLNSPFPKLVKSEGPMPNSLYRLYVKGRLFGQRAENTLWYHEKAGADIAADVVAEDMQDFWQAKILPRVSVDYQVLYYELSLLSGIAYAGGTFDRNRPLMRWSQRYKITGTSSDAGKITGEPTMPSYAAIGMQKVCDGWEESDLITPVPNKRAPRGGIRFAGMIDTDTVSHDNLLDSSVLNSWKTVANFMVQPYTTGHVREYQMCVVTDRMDGFSEQADPGPPASGKVWVARVSSLVVNPYATTQNSRKQSINRLG